MRSGVGAALQIAGSTLRRKRGALVAFAIGMAAFHFVVVATYPAIGGAAAVDSVVRTFPPGLRRLLKLAPNLGAGFGLRDYLALGFFHPVFLGLGAAFVVSRATDALAGEIERGSIYLVLSRPLARWALVVGKALEMFLGAGILAGAGWIGLALGVWTTALPGPIDPLPYLAAAGMAWLLFGALGAGALVISSWGSRTGLVGGLASAWTLISFVLDILPASAEAPPAMLNPWHHYDPQALVAAGTVAPLGVAVLAGWCVAGTALACALWSRRDLS